MPAVILLAGAGSDDRDGAAHGVPTLAQLAGALAEAGFLAVRYDKRGFGQSGGRSESATLSDYAEDVRAVVRWLSDRKDVDPKRIAVIGHGEGAWVALLAASRERKLAAVVSLAGAGHHRRRPGPRPAAARPRTDRRCSPQDRAAARRAAEADPRRRC